MKKWWKYGSKLPDADNVNVHIPQCNICTISMKIPQHFYWKRNWIPDIWKRIYITACCPWKTSYPAAPFSPSKRTTLITSILLAVRSQLDCYYHPVFVAWHHYLAQPDFQTNACINQYSWNYSEIQTECSCFTIAGRQESKIINCGIIPIPSKPICNSFQARKVRKSWLSLPRFQEKEKHLSRLISQVLLLTPGKKVIIVDLDMRKPKIHLGFNVLISKEWAPCLSEKINRRLHPEKFTR